MSRRVRSGERVIRKCYDCRTQFDATVFIDRRGKGYVVCVRCGKKIRVNTVSKVTPWKQGTSKRY